MAESQKQKVKRQITERDYRILRLLWKWKAVSTMAIAKKFFPEVQPLSCYRRLQYLESDGYIKSAPVDGRFFEVWCLSDKGFRYIRPKLGELESAGYRSESVDHDFIATVFHLGEWLTRQPPQARTYSEQQLRRIHPDLWPSWVPKSTLHRPDGYSLDYRGSSPLIYAFEAEISVKAKCRYESVVAFYDSEASVSAIFWLVSSPGELKAILSAFQKFQIRDLGKHHFLFLKDFKAKGWAAPFVEGTQKGKTLEHILHPEGVTMASQWHRGQDVLSLLANRKRPTNTAT